MILVREEERRETQATSAAVAVAKERMFYGRNGKGQLVSFNSPESSS
jgi:hypothetical protein